MHCTGNHVNTNTVVELGHFSKAMVYFHKVLPETGMIYININLLVLTCKICISANLTQLFANIGWLFIQFNAYCMH